MLLYRWYDVLYVWARVRHTSHAGACQLHRGVANASAQTTREHATWNSRHLFID